MAQSPLEIAGAQIEPTSAAPLHTNEFFTGLWTQGNPLGPGAVPFLYQKFYSASRYDRLVGGQNVEVTSDLTLGRRPGHSIYNAGPFPPINRFYEFHVFQNSAEQIHIMASCDPASGSSQGSMRDVTGPSTNLNIWNKNPAASRTGFQAVGNILYFGDGVDTNKWVQSGQGWVAGKQWNTGDWIIDSNNNIEWAIGAETANIVNIQIDNLDHGSPIIFHDRLVTLWFNPSTPLNIKNNTQLQLSGLTTVPALNGGIYSVTVNSATQVRFVVPGTALPITAYSAETGSANTSDGISGSTPPVWNTTPEHVTLDGGVQWVNMGSAVQNWGGDAPTIAPTITQTASPSLYPDWQPNTWYSPTPFIIVDSNGNFQQLIGPAAPTIIKTSSSGPPTWSTIPGAITTETGGGANAQWKMMGGTAWAASHAYAVGDLVMATYTYTITVPVLTYSWNGYTNVPTVTYQQQQVTATSLFTCTQAGTSNPSRPNWTNGIGTTTSEASPSTVAWKNVGNAPSWPGTSQTLSLSPKVMDTNRNVEAAQTTAESGASISWATGGTGAITLDGSQSWVNAGSFSAANQYAWIWAYSGKNSITGHISTASPLSAPLILQAGQLPVIQGPGLADPQWDIIVLWRTVQGGSQLLYDDEFPNPGAGQTWIYTDTNQDPSSTTAPQAGQLNFLITAPINSSNNPPPVGFIPHAYYLNRIWGYVGNRLIWSNGPSTITGSGDESFNPLNQTTFPSAGVTCWATSIGLICYTRSDIWVLLGQGTSNSPFYVVMFQDGIGLAGADAFTVNGSTAYGMLTSGQVVSMDPGAGEIEVGFPIGDQFDELYVGADTYCAWHQGSSADMALYVADGSQGWFRMAPVAAPENGNVWSNRALIQGGVKAITSAEIVPGTKRLLLGPVASGGPILMRDKTTWEDNATPFAASAEIASIPMAQPGLQAGVQFITTEERTIAGASRIIVSVLFDEIEGDFLTLRNVTNDPPNLEPSQSIQALRHWTSQDAGTISICRHMKLDFAWPAEDFANELLTYTIYGRLPQKARK